MARRARNGALARALELDAVAVRDLQQVLPHRRVDRVRRAVAVPLEARVGLAAKHGEEKTVMIDATYLKAHRTATSMAAKKGGAVA